MQDESPVTERAVVAGGQSDLALVQAIEQGERGAFRELVGRYQRRLYRYARGLVRSDAEAEDVVQETFLAVWRSLSGETAARQADGSVRGWLYAICRNAAYRRGRRRVGEPAQHTSLEQAPNQAEGLADLGARAGWGTDEDPEALSARLESRATVRAALSTLPDDDRDIIWLRDIEELSGEETAAILGIGLLAMKSRLHRARLKLVAALRNTDDAVARGGGR